MSYREIIKAARDAGRKVFGADHDVAIARCPAWGGDDVCLLVYGARHAEAAAAYGAVKGISDLKIVPQKGGGWRGLPAYSYSAVSFKYASQEVAS